MVCKKGNFSKRVNLRYHIRKRHRDYYFENLYKKQFDKNMVEGEKVGKQTDNINKTEENETIKDPEATENAMSQDENLVKDEPMLKEPNSINGQG